MREYFRTQASLEQTAGFDVLPLTRRKPVAWVVDKEQFNSCMRLLVLCVVHNLFEEEVGCAYTAPGRTQSYLIHANRIILKISYCCIHIMHPISAMCGIH